MKFIVMAALVLSTGSFAKGKEATFFINGVKIATGIQMNTQATTAEVKPDGTIVPYLCGDLADDYTSVCLASTSNAKITYLTITKKSGDILYIPVVGRTTAVSTTYKGRGADNDSRSSSYIVDKLFSLAVK